MFSSLNMPWLYYAPNLVYCQVPKVSSTNVLTIMAKLNGIEATSATVHRIRLPTLTDMKDKKQLEIMKNSTKFLVVRHPFHRLLSCYFSKLVPNAKNKIMMPHLANKILKKVGSRNKYPSFFDFCTFIVSSNHSRETSREFLISQRHWLPQIELCNVCSIDFDAIIKLENSEKEYKLFFENKGIHNVSVLLKNDQQTYEEKVSKYFSTLGDNLLNQIYSYYKNDFRFFNYSVTHLTINLIK